MVIRMTSKMEQKMKNITLFLAVCFSFFLFSCGDMNEIQREFEEMEEQVYLGKIDSLKGFQGINSVKLTWYYNADPRIQNTVIYWNLRRDSLVIPVKHTTPGVRKDSVVIEGLSQNSHLFEMRNVNSLGQKSLFSTVTVKAWDLEYYRSKLGARKVSNIGYNFNDLTFKLSTVSAVDGVVHSRLKYKNREGVEVTKIVENNVESLLLSDFAAGEDLSIQSLIVPPYFHDSIYTDYEVYKTPYMNFKSSKRKKVLSLTDAEGSLFVTTPDRLLQRNPQGQLVAYSLNEAGDQFVKSGVLQGDWSEYRCMVYYDPDRVITVHGTTNNLSMHRIQPDRLVHIREFAWRWAHVYFMTLKNKLFSTVKNGAMLLWRVDANGVFIPPSPAEKIVARGFNVYLNFISGYRNEGVFSLDETNFLWFYFMNAEGEITSTNKMGQSRFTYILMLDFNGDLLCLDNKGDLWLHPFAPDTSDAYWVFE